MFRDMCGNYEDLWMTQCRVCLLIRTVLLAIVLGGGAGWLVAQSLGPGNLSMIATFFGALLPVLWYVRDTRPRR